MNIRPIILSGGDGKRLWPMSRKSLPKQFINFFKNENLFDLTLKRIKNISTDIKPIVIANENHLYQIKSSLIRNKIDATILLEPIGKNTTAAIYLAAKKADPNDVLIILPSDHLINDISYFHEIIFQASEISLSNAWITLGVKPTEPSTDYGYIEVEPKNKNPNYFDVKKFIEKPNFSKAKNLYLKNNLFWNAGIFIAKTSFVVKSISKYAPEIVKYCDLAVNKTFENEKGVIRFDKATFDKIPAKSIDYSVLEKEKRISLIPFKKVWSDIGSWDSFSNMPNKISKTKNLIELNSKNNFIISEKRLLATIGIKNTIIIDSDNATLIMKKGESNNVKNIVSQIEMLNRSEAKEHTFEYRPWGYFENLLDNDQCKVKRLIVNPKKRLSLQYHNHRSEHWVVISGKASVHLNGKDLKLLPGESLYINKGDHHYIGNDQNKKLIIIEVQVGTYFGEDDIVRLDDPYLR